MASWSASFVSSSYVSSVVFLLDRNAANKERATEMFKKIGEAYDVLSDPEKKKIYDQYGEEGLKGSSGDGFPGGFGPGGPRIVFTTTGPGGTRFMFRDPFQMFSEMFGGDMFGQPSSSSRSHRPPAPSKPVKDPTITHELLMSLDELYTGAVKKMKIERNITTRTGSTSRESRLITLEIKPGYKAGTKFTFEQHGDEAPGHIPADVVFVVKERPHPVYTRDGNNLICRLPIPLSQALCGFELPLSYLCGQTKTIRHLDVLTPGEKMNITGGGMPLSKEPGKYGDLIIDFQIKFPSTLTDEQKRRLTALLRDK
jgi:DnaJ-class molecular chaperone